MEHQIKASLKLKRQQLMPDLFVLKSIAEKSIEQTDLMKMFLRSMVDENNNKIESLKKEINQLRLSNIDIEFSIDDLEERKNLLIKQQQ